MKRRISELMRAGAAIRPQCYFELFDKGGSCAMGAAFEACTTGFGFPPYPWHYWDFVSRYKGILDVVCVNPVTRATSTVFTTIVWLNNIEKWTREEIADWVEQIEAEEAAKEMQVDRFLAERNPEPVLA